MTPAPCPRVRLRRHGDDGRAHGLGPLGAGRRPPDPIPVVERDFTKLATLSLPPTAGQSFWRTTLGRSSMETWHDMRVSRRRFLTTAGATAAAVGAPGALASVASAHGDGGHHNDRIPRDRNQHPAVYPARPAGHRPRGHPAGAGARSATPGSSTPASSAAPSPSSRPPWTPPACGRPRATSSSPSRSTRRPGAPRWPTPIPSGPATSSTRSSGSTSPPARSPEPPRPGGPSPAT